MVKKMCVLLMVIGFCGTLWSQRKGSQELGGGASFWTLSEKDTTRTNVELSGIWGHYLARDLIFEIEPRITLYMSDRSVEMTGLLLGGISKKLFDMAAYDRSSRSFWARKDQRSGAGIYGTVSGGIWLDRADDVNDVRIYSGPAVSIGLETRSQLGSLTFFRTRFYYSYLFPAPPLHDSARTIFAVMAGFSVLSRL